MLHVVQQARDYVPKVSATRTHGYPTQWLPSDYGVEASDSSNDLLDDKFASPRGRELDHLGFLVHDIDQGLVEV